MSDLVNDFASANIAEIVLDAVETTAAAIIESHTTGTVLVGEVVAKVEEDENTFIVRVNNELMRVIGSDVYMPNDIVEIETDGEKRIIRKVAGIIRQGFAEYEETYSYVSDNLLSYSDSNGFVTNFLNPTLKSGALGLINSMRNLELSGIFMYNFEPFTLDALQYLDYQVQLTFSDKNSTVPYSITMGINDFGGDPYSTHGLEISQSKLFTIPEGIEITGLTNITAIVNGSSSLTTKLFQIKNLALKVRGDLAEEQDLNVAYKLELESQFLTIETGSDKVPYTSSLPVSTIIRAYAGGTQINLSAQSLLYEIELENYQIPAGDYTINLNSNIENFNSFNISGASNWYFLNDTESSYSVLKCDQIQDAEGNSINRINFGGDDWYTSGQYKITVIKDIVVKKDNYVAFLLNAGEEAPLVETDPVPVAIEYFTENGVNAAKFSITDFPSTLISDALQVRFILQLYDVTIARSTLSVKRQIANEDIFSLTLDNDIDILVYDSQGNRISTSLPIVTATVYKGQNSYSPTDFEIFTCKPIDENSWYEKPENYDAATESAANKIKGLYSLARQGAELTLTIERLPKDSISGSFQFKAPNGAVKTFSYKVIMSDVDYDLVVSQPVVNTTTSSTTSRYIAIRVKKSSSSGVELLTLPGNESIDVEYVSGGNWISAQRSNDSDSDMEEWGVPYVKGQTASTKVRIRQTAAAGSIEQDFIWDEEIIEFVHDGTSPYFIALNNDSDVITKKADGTLISQLPVVIATPYIGNVEQNIQLKCDHPTGWTIEDYTWTNNTLTIDNVPSSGEFIFTWEADNGNILATKIFSISILVGTVDYDLVVPATVINNTDITGTYIQAFSINKRQEGSVTTLTKYDANEPIKVFVGTKEITSGDFYFSYDSTATIITIKIVDATDSSKIWDEEIIEFVHDGIDGQDGEDGADAVVYTLTVTPTSWNATQSTSVTPTFTVTKYTGNTPSIITTGYTIKVDGSTWTETSISDTKTFDLYVGSTKVDSKTVTKVANGINGSNGYNNAVVRLYKRSTTGTLASNDKGPTGYLTYSFSSGAFTTSSTSSSYNGWSQTIPDKTEGPYCFMIQKSISSTSTTISVSPTNGWSSPTIFIEPGEPGAVDDGKIEEDIKTHMSELYDATEGIDRDSSGNWYINVTNAIVKERLLVGTENDPLLYVTIDNKSAETGVVRFGGWEATATALYSKLGVLDSNGKKKPYAYLSGGGGLSAKIGEETVPDLIFKVGSNFGVDKTGALYANAGKIGGCEIIDEKLTIPTANITGTLTADRIIGGELRSQNYINPNNVVQTAQPNDALDPWDTSKTYYLTHPIVDSQTGYYKYNHNNSTWEFFGPALLGSKLSLIDGTFDSPNLKWDKEGKIIAKAGEIAGWGITPNRLISTYQDTSGRGTIYLQPKADSTSNYWFSAAAEYDDENGNVQSNYVRITNKGVLEAQGATFKSNGGGVITLDEGGIKCATDRSRENVTEAFYCLGDAGCFCFTDLISTKKAPFNMVFGWSPRGLKPENGEGHYGEHRSSEITGLIIESNGTVGLVTNNANVGLVLNPYNNTGHQVGTWSTDSSTATDSDKNLKHDIASLDDNYSNLFDALQPMKFKYNNGTSNRYHTGFVAQDVCEATVNAGLTTNDFAAYVEFADEDGNVECGLRYEEFVSLNTWQIQKLKARVTELEKIIAEMQA